MFMVEHGRIIRSIKMVKFVMLYLGLLALVQPGALVLANLDAPYGFIVELGVWLSAFIGISPVILIFLYWKWEDYGWRGLAFLVVSVTLLTVTVYLLQYYYIGIGESLYCPTVLQFLASHFLSATFALVTLPVALKNLPDVYSYDPMMGYINLTLLGTIIALGVIAHYAEPPIVVE